LAKLSNSAVILRFVWGTPTFKGRQRSGDTYRYMVQKVAFSYAEGQYEFMKKELAFGVEADVRRELVNLASLYRRHIIGANGNQGTPAGIISSAIGGAKPMSLASALPAWAPRNAEYLRTKRNATGGNKWFDNRGWKRGGHRKGGIFISNKSGPSDVGLLFQESRADTWETMFGPIRITFEKSAGLTAADATSAVKLQSTKAEVKVGTIRVFALGKIMPDMLPVLRTGNMMASDEGNDGLMNLVKAYDPRLAYRLGQRSSITKRYRPTLEPFLGFFLTRSIPAAVGRRIEQGTLGRITRSS
jgi:hypothetical protein